MKHPAKVLRIIESISIFAAIPKSELLKIIEHCDYVKKPVESVLYQEGEPASNIYIILKGAVKMLQNYPESPVEIVEIGEGHSLGEASVIGIQHHSSTAMVCRKAELLVISRTVLIQLQQDDPQLFSLLILNIARELARRVSRYSSIIAHLHNTPTF